MIKNFLRSVAINALGIFLATRINSDLIKFNGGIHALLIAGLIIVLANVLVRPVLNLLLLPIHLLTLGTFRWVTNLLIFYLVSRLVPQFIIKPYLSPLINLSFITIPPIYFSIFGSYLLASLLLSLIFQFLYWLFEN